MAIHARLNVPLKKIEKLFKLEDIEGIKVDSKELEQKLKEINPIHAYVIVSKEGNGLCSYIAYQDIRQCQKNCSCSERPHKIFLYPRNFPLLTHVIKMAVDLARDRFDQLTEEEITAKILEEVG